MNSKINYSVLRQRAIIDVLIGDTQLGTIALSNGTHNLIMPYLKGSDLISLCRMFGFNIKEDKWKSRWMYLEELIGYCILKDKCEELFSYLFSQNQIQKIIGKASLDDAKLIYCKTKESAISFINAQLLHTDYEMRIISNKVIFASRLDTNIVNQIMAPRINNQYIADITARAITDINNGDFDSAITKSRTLLEEVFIFVLNEEV